MILRHPKPHGMLKELKKKMNFQRDSSTRPINNRNSEMVQSFSKKKNVAYMPYIKRNQLSVKLIHTTILSKRCKIEHASMANLFYLLIVKEIKSCVIANFLYIMCFCVRI